MSTQAQHTPGPWEVSKVRAFGGFGVVASNGGNIAATRISTRLGYAHTEEEDRANAILIAAGPDLLAACEAVISTIDQLAENSAGIMAECHREQAASLRAAIAKARGEA